MFVVRVVAICIVIIAINTNSSWPPVDILAIMSLQLSCDHQVVIVIVRMTPVHILGGFYCQGDTCTHIGWVLLSGWHLFTHWVVFIVRVTHVHTLGGFYSQGDMCTHIGCVLLSGWHVYTHWVGFIVRVTPVHTLGGLYYQGDSCTHIEWVLLSGCTHIGWVLLSVVDPLWIY